jgi:transposase InsO family protein
MPWRETCVVDERVRFIAALREAEEPFAVICERFEISRKTGYKWLARYEEGGPAALVDGEPVPRRCRHATPGAVVNAVVEARKAHPFWGPKKLRSWLSEREPTLALPAASTIGTLLLRHGLIRPRRRRPREPLTGTALTQCDRPNAVWSVDFKGHFGLGDGTRCHPLTVSDGFSRYLLRCEGLSEPREEPVRVQFERVFREFGLPARIRSDNGAPFATQSPAGLSALSVWWIKLGIVPERIEPGHPEQNGRHERMHRTLKAEATRPAEINLTAQQRVFDRFRREYNDERPHEALNQTPPARHYTPSPRVFPEHELPPPHYGDDVEVRLTYENGTIGWPGGKVLIGRVLAGEPVAVERIGAGRWRVRFGPIVLGAFAEGAGTKRLVPIDATSA